MRTNAHLYDTNTVHGPAWNHPAATKFAKGDKVATLKGKNGIINSVLAAPSTSDMECREHCYYVQFPGEDRRLLEERDLVPAVGE